MLLAATSVDSGSSLLWALVLGYVVAILLTASLAAYVARRHWETPIGRTFTVLVVSFTFWIFGSLARLFVADPETFIAVSTIKYVGVTTAPVWFVLFALLYAGSGQWVTRRSTAALLVVPALELLALATTLSHRSFYGEFTATTLGPVPILQAEVGPAFWFFASYGWGLLVIGSVVFVAAAIKRSGLYRAQAAVVILAILVSWAANVAYVVWDWPHHALDPTPFGFAVTSLLLAVGIFSTRLIDVVPAARSLVLDAIDESVVVLDPKGRVVDANETARRLFEADRPIGEPAEEVLPDALDGLHSEGSATVELDDDGETRHFRHRRIPIGPDGTYGRVIVLTDLTPQVRMRRDLERQNEQLEEFAAVVSHDLRNPLNVAQGNLRLAREERDGERLAAIEEAHDRMSTFIEDLLALARQGRTVGEVEPVDVRAVARRAWSAVQTPGESLELPEEPITILADEGRLAQLLENLLRNSVEHGSTGSQTASDDAAGHSGSDVSVRIGSLEGGFYVEDDGPGFGDAEPSTLFERGVSTKESGTGFGLAIVASIVDAHGWRIDAVEGSDGGARFEITGVEGA